ncbi:MAG TPA: hypothetical protein ENN58_04220, partial [bacterium]|nr:hypothetical protein [bacterium]
MKTVDDLTRYIEETLGIKIKPVLRGNNATAPLFLTNLYYLYETTLIDSKVLFIIDKGREELTPASVKKHISLIREKWGAEVIYVRNALSSFNRKRLIKHKVPFIIPGNQMYIPMAGIDLREYFRKSILEKPVFSPSTQVFLLSVMINDDYGPYCPKNIAQKLGYSPMTLTRAFDELEATEIGIHSISGKDRILTFECDKKALWKKIQPYLQSPVKKRTVFFGNITEKMYKAGLTALSAYSMIAEGRPVYAASADTWKKIDKETEAYPQ